MNTYEAVFTHTHEKISTPNRRITVEANTALEARSKVKKIIIIGEVIDIRIKRTHDEFYCQNGGVV